MTTFAELTDATMMYLYGFTTLQDQATYLTSNITAVDLVVPVADHTAMSRGVVEIEDELLWVDTVDTQNLQLKIPPYGRGFRGSTAATHAVGSRVVSSPLFPRLLVKRAINEAIGAVYPNLWGTGSTTFTFNPARSTYELPAGAKDVLAVSWQSIGPSREWMPIRRWRVDRNADPATFTTGATISIYDAVVPGRTVRVVFSKQPSTLDAASDVFTTVTGLPASCEDVIRLGAAYRMVPFFDSPHLSGMSAEADFAANQRPVGGASQLGRFLLQSYQLRLAEEAQKLHSLFPARSHYSR